MVGARIEEREQGEEHRSVDYDLEDAPGVSASAWIGHAGKYYVGEKYDLDAAYGAPEHEQLRVGMIVAEIDYKHTEESHRSHHSKGMNHCLGEPDAANEPVDQTLVSPGGAHGPEIASVDQAVAVVVPGVVHVVINKAGLIEVPTARAIASPECRADP